MNGIEDYWNLPFSIVIIFYICAAIASFIFLLGFWDKARIWASGKDTTHKNPSADKLKGKGPLGLLWSLFLISIRNMFEGLLARRVLPQRKLRGIFLIGIIGGFALLFLGTVGRAINTWIAHILSGNVWLIFSFVLDMAALFLLIGTIYALIRRYIWKSEKLVTSNKDGIFLFFILFLILSGYSIEGIRIVVLNPPGIDWSPIGYLFGVIALKVTEGHEATLRTIHFSLWIFHASLALCFIAYIPFSKGIHIFATQITTSLAAERRKI